MTMSQVLCFGILIGFPRLSPIKVVISYHPTGNMLLAIIKQGPIKLFDLC